MKKRVWFGLIIVLFAAFFMIEVSGVSEVNREKQILSYQGDQDDTASCNEDLAEFSQPLPYPRNCSGVSLSYNIQALVNGQSQPIANPVKPGDSIEIRNYLGTTLPNGCAIQYGQLSNKMPNGKVIRVAGFLETPEVPLVDFITPFLIDSPENYIVDPADSCSDVIVFRGDYGATVGSNQCYGYFLTSPATHTASAAASIPLHMESLCGDSDVDYDNDVDVDDLTKVTSAFGQESLDCIVPEDIDENGKVDIDDLVSVILSWNDNCETGMADLAIVEAFTIPQGNEMGYGFMVRNNGDSVVPAGVFRVSGAVSFVGGGNVIEQWPNAQSIAPGETAQFAIGTHIPQSDSYQVTLTVDSQNDVIELDETNNQYLLEVNL